MIVVSNTSPTMNLAAIGQLNLLERLYGKVLIPEAVLHELSAIDPEQLRIPAIEPVLWIEMRSVVSRSLVASLLLELDAGEAEAIVLATETKADLLLLDERRGREVASRLGLRVTGYWAWLLKPSVRGSLLRLNPCLTV